MIYVLFVFVVFATFTVFFFSPIKYKFSMDRDNEVFPVNLGVCNAYLIKNGDNLILVDTGDEGYQLKNQ